MKIQRKVRQKKAVSAGKPVRSKKTILAAIDFSPIADPVIRKGVEFARAFKTQLVLLHVIQPPVYMAGDTDLTQLTAAAEQAADRRLARLAAGLRKEHEYVETRRLTGSPVSLILGEAGRLQATCIVIGSHGHGAVYDLLVGSTASGVLGKAPCPVVIVPAAELAVAGAAEGA